MASPFVRPRQTRILATLGPASTHADTLEALFLAGADAFRLNFSHGTHTDHRDRFDALRRLEEKYQHPIPILADLQGPKLRVGSFLDGSIALTPGMRLRLDLDPTLGDSNRVCLPHPEIITAMEQGAILLCDDGRVRLEVIEKGVDYLFTRVIAGNRLSDKKGVNVPGVVLPIPALTPKDIRDLDFALSLGVDWVAQSFVQTPDDVADARRRIAGRAALMVKLEKPSAVQNILPILDLCDGVMIARGDLGVEMPPEDVPIIQKKIVRLVRHRGKPVVVATQMLESMIDNPSPTRAEASDVATAVYHGADAVMLSAETAAGRYPLEAVAFMDRVCRRVERDADYRRLIDSDHAPIDGDTGDSIAAAADRVAGDIGAKAIMTFTTTGSTTLRTAKQRPRVPILSMTNDLTAARRLGLSYGVSGIFTARTVTDLHTAITEAKHVAHTRQLTQPGDKLVMTAGEPFGTPGSTNVLRVVML